MVSFIWSQIRQLKKNFKFMFIKAWKIVMKGILGIRGYCTKCSLIARLAAVLMSLLPTEFRSPEQKYETFSKMVDETYRFIEPDEAEPITLYLFEFIRDASQVERHTVRELQTRGMTDVETLISQLEPNYHRVVLETLSLVEHKASKNPLLLNYKTLKECVEISIDRHNDILTEHWALFWNEIEQAVELNETEQWTMNETEQSTMNEQSQDEGGNGDNTLPSSPEETAQQENLSEEAIPNAEQNSNIDIDEVIDMVTNMVIDMLNSSEPEPKYMKWVKWCSNYLDPIWRDTSYMLEYWMAISEIGFILLIFIVCIMQVLAYLQILKKPTAYKGILIISIIFFILQIWFLSVGSVLGWYTTNILHQPIPIEFGENQFLFGNVIFNVRIFIFLVGICIFVFLFRSQNDNAVFFSVPLLILLNMDAVCWIFTVDNYFLMFLVLEFQSLSLYLLASIRRSNLSAEAGLKYFLYGSFASGFLVFGVSLIYLSTGTCNINEINQLLLGLNTNNPPLIYMVGLLFILAGLLFKLGVAPFHFWVPDVYDGAPLVIVYFFSTITKIPLIYLLYRAFGMFLNPLLASNLVGWCQFDIYCLLFTSVILISGLSSMILGAFGAYNELNIKRFLAFSSIVNMGYILVSLSQSSYEGLFAAIYYLFLYILIIVQIFTILLIFRKDRDLSTFKYLTQLSTLLHGSPIFALALACSFLSLAGIPPFPGFFGKLMIIVNFIEAGNYFQALCLILISVWIAVYYIRLFRFIFFFLNLNKGEFIQKFLQLSHFQKLFVILIFLINILFFFIQGPYILFINMCTEAFIHFV